MSKTISCVLFALGCASILIIMLLSFFRPLWVDPSILLVEMERIAEGYVPYKTMHLNYPPFWFYLMVGLKKVFNVPYGYYNFYLTVHYIFSIGCAGCIYEISKEFGSSKWISLATAWFFLFISMWLWGDCVLFEIPTAFWGLLTCVLILRNKNNNPALFIAFGFVCALSFLSKQFGAGFFPLSLWLIFTYSSNKQLFRSGLFSIGYFIPLFICLLLWGGDFVNSTLLNGYGGSGYRELIGDSTTNIGRYFRGMFFVCTRFPMIPLGVLFLPFAINQDKWRQTLFCLFGIGGFALQFFYMTVRSLTISDRSLHYLLLLAPFIALLTSVLATSRIKFFNVMLTSCLVVTCLFSTYKLVRWSVPEYFNDNESHYQQSLSNEVKKIVKKTETAWIVDGDLGFLYYKADIKPASMDKVGYSSGSKEMTAEKAKIEMRNVDYVILFDWEGLSDPWRIYYDYEVKSYVESFPKIKIGDRDGSDIVVYCMKDD